MLDAALARYAEERGAGIDNWNPRAFKTLPLEMKLRLLDVFELWENDPEMFVATVSSIVFLDKPDGGHRPIGLIVAILSVWSRIRSETCREWEAKHEADFFWGTSAQPVEKAGWEHNMLAAWAKAKGLTVITLVGRHSKILRAG